MMLVTLVKAPDTLMAAFGWDICLVVSPLEDGENPLRSSPTLFDGKSQKIKTECGVAVLPRLAGACGDPIQTRTHSSIARLKCFSLIKKQWGFRTSGIYI